MRGQDLLEVIENLDPAYIEAASVPPKKKKAVWLKWAAVAACLCVAVIICLPRLRQTPPETPTVQTPADTADPGIGPSSLTVNGVKYIVSSWFTVYPELPEGFTMAGTADVGGYEERPYYTNPDAPEWVYVYQEVRTNGTVDATGTLVQTEPHNAYVRFVDERLRGKELLCSGGEYFISMWSAHSYGAHPDVTSEYYDAMENRWGHRIEGDAPEGFTLIGTSEFSGRDSIPRGPLTSNTGLLEVYANPADPDVLLASTFWYNVNGYHTGFNVYIRYDCPFAE